MQICIFATSENKVKHVISDFYIHSKLYIHIVYIIRTTLQPLPTPCRGLVVDRNGDAILIYGPPANSNKARDTNISGRLI